MNAAADQALVQKSKSIEVEAIPTVVELEAHAPQLEIMTADFHGEVQDPGPQYDLDPNSTDMDPVQLPDDQWVQEILLEGHAHSLEVEQAPQALAMVDVLDESPLVIEEKLILSHANVEDGAEYASEASLQNEKQSIVPPHASPVVTEMECGDILIPPQSEEPITPVQDPLWFA